ncbi:hypothetical protein F5Y16DRAFT_418625 [Xylariaceae sp. FL0255]|nr:hypothetical protein F5Y16DRAFT_418625 [Xylariaceae sp. FL0255]
MASQSAHIDIMDSGGPDLQGVPLEILFYTCDFLGTHEVYQLMRVCKELREALELYALKRLVLLHKRGRPSSDTNATWPDTNIGRWEIGLTSSLSRFETTMLKEQRYTLLPHWSGWHRPECWPPMYTAAQFNRADVIALLEERSFANINERFRDFQAYYPSGTECYSTFSQGVLDIAIRFQHFPLAADFLRRADTRVGSISLYKAAKADNVQGFRMILSSGKILEKHSRTPLILALCHAAKMRSSEWIDIMLSLGIDLYRKLTGPTYQYPYSILQRLIIFPFPSASVLRLIELTNPDQTWLRYILRGCTWADKRLEVTKHILQRPESTSGMWIETYISAIELDFYELAKELEWPSKPNEWTLDYIIDGLRKLSSSDLNQVVTYKRFSATILEHALRAAFLRDNKKFDNTGENWVYIPAWEWIAPLLRIGADTDLLSSDGLDKFQWYLRYGAKSREAEDLIILRYIDRYNLPICIHQHYYDEPEDLGTKKWWGASERRPEHRGLRLMDSDLAAWHSLMLLCYDPRSDEIWLWDDHFMRDNSEEQDEYSFWNWEAGSVDCR